MKFYLAAALAAASLATTAQAVTFFTIAGAPDNGVFENETIIFDFEQETPELSGDFELVTGTTEFYAAPAGNETQYVVVPRSGLPSGAATLDLTGVGEFSTFSFYWGSMDAYNRLELLNGDNVFFTVDGTQLPPADGDQDSQVTNRRVFFVLDPGETVTSLRFVSDGVAFEFDDFAIGTAAVPEPASWALMIAGFGLVGFAARRQRRTPTVLS